MARGLSGRGCEIPQEWFTQTPHNIVSGAFRKPGQTDWAALCSIAGRSTTLVFWDGAAGDVEEVPQSGVADKNWLQEIGAGRIGYSRRLDAVGKSFIDYYDEAFGNLVPPPPIDHEGINDAFMEKASTVNYWHEGRWLKLAGAD